MWQKFLNSIPGIQPIALMNYKHPVYNMYTDVITKRYKTKRRFDAKLQLGLLKKILGNITLAFFFQMDLLICLHFRMRWPPLLPQFLLISQSVNHSAQEYPPTENPSQECSVTLLK